MTVVHMLCKAPQALTHTVVESKTSLVNYDRKTGSLLSKKQPHQLHGVLYLTACVLPPFGMFLTLITRQVNMNKTLEM